MNLYVILQSFSEKRTYHNRFFAKARPEPDFKYFSNKVAFNLSSKPKNATILHGLQFLVCIEPPEL